MTDTSTNPADGQTGPGKMPLARSIVLATVVGFGVVSFWRGVWYLWDVFTFHQPEDRLFSALASLITGVVILAVLRTFYSVLAPPIHRINIR